MIPQNIKDRAPKASAIESGTEHDTNNMGATVKVGHIDSDDTARVTIDDQWLDAEDCLELAVFFKRLAKRLHRG